MTQICIALIGSYVSNVKNNKKVAKVRLFYVIIKFLLQNESECIILLKFGSLAQLVEHLTLNQGVQGSNPWRSTKRLRREYTSLFFIFLIKSQDSICLNYLIKLIYFCLKSFLLFFAFLPVNDAFTIIIIHSYH